LKEFSTGTCARVNYTNANILINFAEFVKQYVNKQYLLQKEKEIVNYKLLISETSI